MSKLRDQLKQGLREGVAESYRTKDSTSKNIFNSDKIKNYNFYKPGPGNHCVAILPFFIGKNHPLVKIGKKKVGESFYNVDLWVHRNVGPNEDTFLCLQKTYREPCPICQYRNDLKDDDEMDDKKVADLLKQSEPKRRVIYAVWDREAESKGVLLWEVSHFLMERNVVSLTRKPKGGFIAFVDPDIEEGRDVAFEIQGSGMNIKYLAHQLVERDEPIPDAILESVPTLDDLITIPTYEEVQYSFMAGESDKDSELELTDKEEVDTDEVEGYRGIAMDCPAGGEFGKDFMAFKECRKCPIGDECEMKNEVPTKTTEGKPPIRRRS
jgi:hypothetical protein